MSLISGLLNLNRLSTSLLTELMGIQSRKPVNTLEGWFVYRLEHISIDGKPEDLQTSQSPSLTSHPIVPLNFSLPIRN
jgi:hypothetical protein